MTTTQTIEVDPLRLSLHLQHATLKAEHGMGLTRNAGTVTSIRAEYGLPPSVRTWAQLADALQPIKAECDHQHETLVQAAISEAVTA